MNNKKPLEETPERNAMQGDFVDDAFCLRFYSAAIPSEAEPKSKRQLKGEIDGKKVGYIINGNPSIPYVWQKDFEKNGIDVAFHLAIEYDAVESAWYSPSGVSVSNTDDLDLTYYSERLKICMKASVGDDYPSVLRHMQQSNANCLYLKNYKGKGVAEEVFKEIFAKQGIAVVYEDQVKA